jgi:hypothetical protein
MKILIAILFSLFASGAISQDQKPLEESDKIIADRLLACASAHATHLRILKEAGLNVDDLYKYIGYFVRVGTAFSSKEYADAKYQSLRDEAYAELTKSLQVPQNEIAASAQAQMNKIEQELRDCATYQHAHAEEIKTRLNSAASSN